jgi:hypothetical protein
MPRDVVRAGDLPVCVLGMGRSGTSLTARVLNLLGVDLGPESGFVPDSPQNSKGYWERRSILELNEALLVALGGDYANPPAFEPGWERRPELAPLQAHARRLIAENFGNSDMWGFKDPRLSLTLPFWRQVVPDMRYVICVRNPMEVFSSFGQYPSEDDFGGKNWFELWLRSTASALVHTGDSERTVVFYEDYFTDLRAQVVNLAAFIARPLTTDAWVAIDAFVEPGLRHQWTDQHEFVFDDEPVADTATLYAALRGLPPNPGAEAIKEVEDLAVPLLRRLSDGRAPRPTRAINTVPASLSPGRDSETLGRIRLGVHGDGWLARDVLVSLAGGEAADLVLRADVLPVDAQRLDVVVDGRTVDSRGVEAGPLDIRIPIPRALGDRSVELRWVEAMPLAAPDRRRAAARLEYLGVEPRLRA